MMNKGLELIEAQWLFNIPVEKIEILIHPQSIIHSMVEFEDGAIMAQLSEPDMRLPIQYALTAPKRLKRASINFNFDKPLTFDKPDLERFPCLGLAMEAARIGGSLPAMMNALNEELVAAYLKGAIKFYDISGLIAAAFEKYNVKSDSLEEIEEAGRWAKKFMKEQICRF